MITKVAFVGQPTTDMDASKRFYGELLGLECWAEHENLWCEFRAADKTTVALDSFSPQHQDKAPTYLALETDDIEAEFGRLREAGVTIVKEPWTNENAEGRTICKMGYVTDPHGNPVMLHEIADWRRED